MACTALQNELNALRSRRKGQAQLVANLPGGAGRQAAQAVLDGIDADIAATEAALDLCLAQEAQAEHPVPQHILGTVEQDPVSRREQGGRCRGALPAHRVLRYAPGRQPGYRRRDHARD